jgi:uncharacterized protein (TIGR02757 family)
MLDAVRASCDVAERRSKDPVAVVHRYSDPLEQELVGLMASAVAFGNAKAFGAKLDQALERLGPSILAVADDEKEVLTRLSGWKHRMYRGEDLGRLLVGARRVQRAHGSLGAFFAEAMRTHGSLRGALIAFVRAIGARMLADPAKSSGCKRLLLYLRWMIRPADGVDLGLWPIAPKHLVIPLDTHVHRLSISLGLTSRKDASWRTAEEITAALRRYCPDDPVRYDFAMCHLGMARRARRRPA